ILVTYRQKDFTLRYDKSCMTRVCKTEQIIFVKRADFVEEFDNYYGSNCSKIELLDFGAGQEFSEKFINLYQEALKAMAKQDYEEYIYYSEQLEFQTGLEAKHMKRALPTIGAFPLYDFSTQTVTERVRILFQPC
ncbi:8014_t:CDS:2, partial [Ambispora gerdemannii]